MGCRGVSGVSVSGMGYATLNRSAAGVWEFRCLSLKYALKYAETRKPGGDTDRIHLPLYVAGMTAGSDFDSFNTCVCHEVLMSGSASGTSAPMSLEQKTP